MGCRLENCCLARPILHCYCCVEWFSVLWAGFAVWQWPRPLQQSRVFSLYQGRTRSRREGAQWCQ